MAAGGGRVRRRLRRQGASAAGDVAGGDGLHVSDGGPARRARRRQRGLHSSGARPALPARLIVHQPPRHLLHGDRRRGGRRSLRSQSRSRAPRSGAERPWRGAEAARRRVGAGVFRSHLSSRSEQPGASGPGARGGGDDCRPAAFQEARPAELVAGAMAVAPLGLLPPDGDGRPPDRPRTGRAEGDGAGGGHGRHIQRGPRRHGRLPPHGAQDGAVRRGRRGCP